jgi:L-asparaginase
VPVAVFTLGGTISFVPGARDGMGALDAGRQLAGVRTPANVELRPVTFRTIPSADLELADLLELAAAIEAAIDAGARGVVVTQGTDTLEESAYLLDLLLPTGAPVVITGAMRNASLPGADGPANLDAALRVAADPLARDLGVLVVLNDRIHLARFVRKQHSSFPSAFGSDVVGPVGWISEGRVRIPLLARRRSAPINVPRDRALPRVALLRSAMGDDDTLLTAVESGGYAGLVIEAFGAGHLSRRLAGTVKTVAGRLPVVFCSRAGAGELFAATADYPGSERDLLDGGLIPGGALDGIKARLLLILLLAAGADRAEIVTRFAETVG